MTRVAKPRRQCLVLLVEDSAETYELYSEVLAKAGYAVVGADNGEEAYQQAVTLAPDLVIMDYELRGPGSNSDGCAATDKLKRDPRTARIPVVMITGRVARHEFERARAAGCDAFLAKPVSYEQLLDEVKRRMHAANGSNTVLLVEDDEDIRASIAEILRDEGFVIVAAADGDDALRYLRGATEVPRLILLDLMMPVMDGWAFRAEQLADERLAKIPVVILSAATDVRRHAAQLRVDEYLIKPLDVPLLLNAIERHI
ncbi:MAG: response regulator [Myxococcales bacterium]|nr:response regulator [Myxococcales bacterium]